MQEHEAIYHAALNPKCQYYGSPTVKVLLTPISWLHIVDKPFITVFIDSVYNKRECEIQTRQQIQDMMALIIVNGQGVLVGARGSGNTREILLYRVYKETKAIKYIWCKVVAYCGKEHQKAD